MSLYDRAVEVGIQSLPEESTFNTVANKVATWALILFMLSPFVGLVVEGCRGKEKPTAPVSVAEQDPGAPAQKIPNK